VREAGARGGGGGAGEAGGRGGAGGAGEDWVTVLVDGVEVLGSSWAALWTQRDASGEIHRVRVCERECENVCVCVCVRVKMCARV